MSIVIDEKESEVVREMYRWLLEEQMSSHAIQRRLNERSVPPRKNRQRGWWQSAVIHVLGNPVYKGEGYYNRMMRVDAWRPHGDRGFKDMRPGNLRSRTLRPREEWIPVRAPAIIDPDTFAKLAGRFDLILNTVSANLNMGDYLNLLAVDGTLVELGIPEHPMAVPAFPLAGGRRIGRWQSWLSSN